jgi:hypothetical protein
MGELYIRHKCYEHVRRFVDVTAAYEMESVGTTGIGLTAINTGNASLGVGPFFTDENNKRREMIMLKNRMEGWRSCRSYLYYQKVCFGDKLMISGFGNLQTHSILGLPNVPAETAHQRF